MTTKIKIIAGFVLMILLSGMMAGIGWRSLGNASDGFNDVARRSGVAVLFSNLVATLNDMTTCSARFMYSRDAGQVDAALKDLDKAASMLREANAQVSNPQDKAVMNETDKAFPSIRENIGQLAAGVQKLVKSYTDVVRPAEWQVQEIFNGLEKTMIEAGNIAAMRELTHAAHALANCRAVSARMAMSYSEKDGERVLARLKELGEALSKIDPLLQTEAGRVEFARLTSAYNIMLKAGQDNVREVSAMQEVLQHYLSQVGGVKKTVAQLQENVSARMRDGSREVAASNRDAQTQMLALSGGALLFGAIIAIFIIVGLVRVLNTLRNFAESIAEGDFNAHLNIREKGEIGMMTESLRAIPATLNKMLEEYKRMEREISCGILTTAGNVGEFRGEFATLINGTNNILERLR
ncbi:MAG: HAMP domain-containing protein, partial [Desulfovibrio sp.]|nr:HAMP domain-containing protein [Desulfovibrio sp.]